LLGAQFGGIESGRLTFERRLTGSHREDVFVGGLIDDGDLLLLAIERRYQFAGQVLLGSEHSRALARPVFDLRRIGAEETGGIHHLTRHDGVVLAHVMAFHAESPYTVRGWIAKHGEEVAIRITLLSVV